MRGHPTPFENFRGGKAELAVISASPKLIDQVIADEERAEPELPFGDASGGDGESG